jgi:hypothetical protein
VKSFKRLFLSIPLAGFITITIMAAVGAHENRVEVEQAKSAILGTLVCEKNGEDSWAGWVTLRPSSGFAHGICLVQPGGSTTPWKEVLVKGSFTFDDSETPSAFEQQSDFWPKENRLEFFLHHPPVEAAKLSVTISGIQSVWHENQLKLDVVNMLCGCEELVGDFLEFIAYISGLISMVLGSFTMRAFRRESWHPRRFFSSHAAQPSSLHRLDGCRQPACPIATQRHRRAPLQSGPHHREGR